MEPSTTIPSNDEPAMSAPPPGTPAPTDKPLPAGRPGAVKAVRILAIIQIVAITMMIALAFILAATTFEPGSAGAGFRHGFLRSLGISPEDFDAEGLGRLMGTFSFSLLGAILLLRFVARRNLTGLRVTAIAMLLLSFSTRSTSLVALIIAVLVFLPETRRYCEQYDEPEPARQPDEM